MLTTKHFVITLLILFVILFVINITYNPFSCNSEGYFYNKLDTSVVLSILSKPCNLTLREYVNIQNSTNNLKTLYLQEICNNYICDKYVINNVNDLERFVKTVAGHCILKCIRNNDIYRLALVNLKINDMLSSMISSLPLFQRSLTNGVYGVETVNIYLGNKQASVKEIVDLAQKSIFSLTDDEINKNVDSLGLNQKDAELYKSIVTEFINKLSNNIPLNENKNNNKKEFSIELFDILSTLNLYKLFTLQSLVC